MNRLRPKEIQDGLLVFAQTEESREWVLGLKFHNRGVRRRWTKRLRRMQRRMRIARERATRLADHAHRNTRSGDRNGKVETSEI